jgi:hypothetical protein
MKSVTRLHRSSAIQAYRDLLVRDLHPLVIRAARAHDVLQIARAKQAEPSLFLFNPAVHAGASDVTPVEGARELAFATDPLKQKNSMLRAYQRQCLDAIPSMLRPVTPDAKVTPLLSDEGLQFTHNQWPYRFGPARNSSFRSLHTRRCPRSRYNRVRSSPKLH